MVKITAKLTPARRRGLAVLYDAEKRMGRPYWLRVSNQTTAGSVYWQVADNLVKQGLATVLRGVVENVVLTDAGRELAAKLEGGE